MKFNDVVNSEHSFSLSLALKLFAVFFSYHRIWKAMNISISIIKLIKVIWKKNRPQCLKLKFSNWEKWKLKTDKTLWSERRKRQKKTNQTNKINNEATNSITMSGLEISIVQYYKIMRNAMIGPLQSEKSINKHWKLNDAIYNKMNVQNVENPRSLQCTSIKELFQRGTKFERSKTEINKEEKLNSIYSNFMEVGITIEY